MGDRIDEPIVMEVHERRCHLLIRSSELMGMIRRAACEKCGIPYSDAVRFEVRLEDETAGSPAYSTGKRAAVTVIEDQMKLRTQEDTND